MRKIFIACAILMSLMAGYINSEGAEIKFKARISFCNWNDKSQCPNKLTASGKRPRDGYCAASKDIIEKFNLQYGQPLYIRGYGRVELQCKTGNFVTKNGKKYPIKNTLDIYKAKNVMRCWTTEVTIAEWE